MQIECKDEFNVYCYLLEDDLKELRTSINTLTYGSNTFRKLIDTIVKRTDEQYPGQFKHRDLPLMVEAIPLDNGELFVQISTVDEADELDPRFAQFSPSIFEDIYFYEDPQSESDTVDIDELYEKKTEPLIQKHTRSFKKASPVSQKSVYVFGSYESMINAIKSCSNIHNLKDLNSSLYYEKTNKNYHLVISGHKNNPGMRTLLASFCEHADLKPFTSTYQAWLNEHCECIIKAKAMGKLL